MKGAKITKIMLNKDNSEREDLRTSVDYVQNCEYQY